MSCCIARCAAASGRATPTSLCTRGRRSAPIEPGGLLAVARHRRRYAADTADIAYGDAGPAHLLDVWRRPDLPPGNRAPVLVHIPGGAWSVNDKRGQGYALMAAMAERGWVCVSVNYRRSPHHAWPAHIVDVKRALAWVEDEYRRLWRRSRNSSPPPADRRAVISPRWPH